MPAHRKHRDPQTTSVQFGKRDRETLTGLLKKVRRGGYQGWTKSDVIRMSIHDEHARLTGRNLQLEELLEEREDLQRRLTVAERFRRAAEARGRKELEKRRRTEEAFAHLERHLPLLRQLKASGREGFTGLEEIDAQLSKCGTVSRLIQRIVAAQENMKGLEELPDRGPPPRGGASDR